MFALVYVFVLNSSGSCLSLTYLANTEAKERKITKPYSLAHVITLFAIVVQAVSEQQNTEELESDM